MELNMPPGSIIKVDNDKIVETRMYLKSDYFKAKQHRWDEYFHKICESVASKSPCNSRQIGVILVRDYSIVATGYNGPPRQYPHCGPECPRKAAGYKSGEHLEECPAAHAEVNAISNAARIGASTVDCTLYMNCIIPCKSCMATIVNAGIKEVVVDELSPYDALAQNMAAYASIRMREFVK